MIKNVNPVPRIGEIEGTEIVIPSICSTWTFVNKNSGEKSRFWCNNWKCTICAPSRARMVKSKIMELVELYNLDRFLTLTCDPKKVPEQAGFNSYLKHVWNKARTQISKHHKGFQYIWVMEWHKQKNPCPHFHMLINTYLPAKWVKHIWMTAGGGWNMDIRKAKDSKEVKDYICKYISKSAIITANKARGKGRVWGRSRSLKTINEMTKFLRPSEWMLVQREFSEVEVIKFDGKNE